MSTYISHPSKNFLDKFFGEDTANYRFRYSKLNDSELNAKRVLSRFLHPEAIIRIPEVNSPDGIPTPDFFIENTRYEIKTPASLNSLENGIKSAPRQIQEAGVLVIELSNYHDSVKLLIAETIRLAKEHPIKNIIIISGNSVIYSNIKKV